MRIDELLNSTYDAELVDEGDGYYSSEFTCDDGSRVSIDFDKFDGGSYDIEFKRNSKFDLTGGGDAFKIFATVIKIIKEFVNTVHPRFIYFSASNSEPSRVVFYKTLVRRLTAGSSYKDIAPTPERLKDESAEEWIKDIIAAGKNKFEVFVLARSDELQ